MVICVKMHLWPLLGIWVLFSKSTAEKVSVHSLCKDGQLIVDITGSNGAAQMPHLQQLKNYPDTSCHPEKLEAGHYRFSLDLNTFYKCGTTQILNKLTGSKTYYNRVVYYTHEGQEMTELVKCPSSSLNNGTRSKRDVLPAGFREAENPPNVGSLIGRAPDPILSMVVKQKGVPIGHDLVVAPGEPLTMEVSLDQLSHDIYGILVSKMDVTDTGTQSEDIILNGCTVDSYLFENFLTSNGDLLEAKFKAFKFPDTNYVLFRATVNVCLNECKGMDCSNGQVGYGRRRRDTLRHDDKTADFEIQATALIRVSNEKKQHRRAAVLGDTGPAPDY